MVHANDSETRGPRGPWPLPAGRGRVLGALLLAVVVLAAAALAAPSSPQVAAAPAARRAAPSGAASAAPLAVARLGRDRLELWPRPGGRRALLRRAPGRAPRALFCGALEGAFDLHVSDVNADGRPDLVIALRKRARFDPGVANRLHVYTLVGERCVPLWRGTRLAGRFTRARPEGSHLYVFEGVGRGSRRLARYRWTGFGYAVDRVLWQGAGAPPRPLVRRYLGEARSSPPDRTKGDLP